MTLFTDAWAAAWHMTTGLWPLVWKLGVTGAAAAALLVFVFMTPPTFLPRLKKTALWVAGVLLYGFAAYSIGVWDESARRDAQQDVGLKIEAQNGEKILLDAERAAARDTPDSVRNDDWNRGPRKK